MFGLTKSRTVVIGVSGIVLAGTLVPLATQAKEKWLIAQVAPDAFNTPKQVGVPAAPDAFGSPSQVGIPAAPSVLKPITPTPRVRKPLRVPIDPVPMPGEARRPLPELTKTPDIRTMEGSDSAILSGISGKVILTPICSVTAPSSTCLARPYTGALKISTLNRDRVIRLAADEQGAFRLRLSPGLYVLEPDASDFPIGTGQTFTVVSSVVHQMEFNFQGAVQTATPGAIQRTAAPGALDR